jgi:aryl carrier-like protein
VLEDGLRQLANQPIDLYIPDLPWDEVSKHFGVSKFFEHLLSEPKDVFSAEKTPHSLASIIAGVLDVSPHDFSAEVPLIAYGLDSLSAARLSFALRGIVPVTQMQLLGNITTSDLRRRAEAAARPSAGECETSIRTDVPLTTAQSTGSTGNITEHYAGTKATMIRLVEELTAGLSPQSFRADASEKGARSSVSSPDTDVSELLLSQEVVLLTGTTGALGAALLAHLAGCSQVAKIFALNRPGTSGSVEDRQAAALREHGLVISDACAAKIVYIEAFMHNDRLGVSPDMFNEVSLKALFCK